VIFLNRINKSYVS